MFIVSSWIFWRMFQVAPFILTLERFPLTWQPDHFRSHFRLPNHQPWPSTVRCSRHDADRQRLASQPWTQNSTRHCIFHDSMACSEATWLCPWSVQDISLVIHDLDVSSWGNVASIHKLGFDVLYQLQDGRIHTSIIMSARWAGGGSKPRPNGTDNIMALPSRAAPPNAAAPSSRPAFDKCSLICAYGCGRENI